MPYTKKSDFAPQHEPETAPPCEVEGCGAPGTYKAPRSREELHDYRWFCLDHIREHNAKWDFFAGYDSQDIEHFIRDATTGHRPTWSRESHKGARVQQLRDALAWPPN